MKLYTKLYLNIPIITKIVSYLCMIISYAN
jgi:hypothetical protein